MDDKKKSTILGLSAALLLFATILSPPASAEKKVLDGVAAIVDERIITVHNLRQRISRLKVDSSKFKEVLDQMIEDVLVEIETEKRGITATEEEIEGAIAQVRLENGLTSNQELLSLIQREGLRYSEFRAGLKKQIERSKFINFVIAPRIKISEQDLKDFYEKEYVRRGRVKVYRLRDIFIEADKENNSEWSKAKRKITALKKRLDTGEDFSALAKKNSDGPTAAKGGLIGGFKMEELQPQFISAIQGLPPGGISEVVDDENGFHLFQVDAIENSSPPAFKDVERQARRRLQTKELESSFQSWLRLAKNNTYIDIKLKDFSG